MSSPLQTPSSPINQSPLSLPQQDQLPHGLEGLSAYPLHYALYIAIAAGVLMLAIAIWWFFKYKRKKTPKEEKLLPPLQVLYDELQKLSPQEPFADDQQAHYFFRLGLVFREILEEAYHFPATDLTLKELKKPLNSKVPLSRDDVHSMNQFFEQTELIKFADAKTNYHEAKNFYQSVLRWSRTIVSRELDHTQNVSQSPSP